jgi:hypothetical protein
MRVREGFYTLMAAIVVMILSFTASVEDWSHTDPKGSLLSGQALIEHGSLDLTPYAETLSSYGWQLIRDGDEVYYAYPVGTTLLHLPAIWLALQCDLDLSDASMEAELNRLFAAISMGIIVFLTMALFRRRGSLGLSLFFTLLIILGSSLFSTLGLALWNLNYAVVFSLAIIVLLDSPEAARRERTGWLVGGFLFLGYICRPSFALFVLTVFAYLALFNRQQLTKAAGLSGLLLAGYLMLHNALLGSYFPPSYSFSQFEFGPEMVPNLAGMLISPSRGLLVFSPFLILTAVGLVRYRGIWRADPWLVSVTVWLLSLTTLLSGWYMWWGGGGFGNRLLAETLPGWVFLSAATWPRMWTAMARNRKWLVRTALMVSAVFSIWLHVVQAGNNQWTVKWYQHPNKDSYPEYFWNPRFPQWMASGKQIEAMKEWHEARHLDQPLNNE